MVSDAFLAPKRVVRAVVGGEAGAKRGASGVPGALSTSSVGVAGLLGSMPAKTWSSISVLASSSSLAMVESSLSAAGKSKRGLTEDRVKGRLAEDSTALSNPPSTSSFSVNLRNCFLPRLQK